MNRIKTRMALLLAATALSSIAMAAPAQAAGGCYPYPEVYCDVQEFYFECVLGPIKYGWDPCTSS